MSRDSNNSLIAAFALCGILLISIAWIWVDDVRTRLAAADEALGVANARMRTLHNQLDRCRADTNRVIQVRW